MPRTNIPGKETHHHCVVLELPEEDKELDLHMIATTPSLDNKMVMHHMLIYACEPGRRLYRYFLI